MPPKQPQPGKTARDTRTGEWVKKEEAKKRPATTVTETIKPPKKT